MHLQPAYRGKRYEVEIIDVSEVKGGRSQIGEGTRHICNMKRERNQMRMRGEGKWKGADKGKR